MTLTAEQQKDLLKRGFSRRSFAQLATMIAAGSTLPFYNEPALAQLSKVDNVPADAVMINANENPLGPCPEALEAVHKIAANGGRYMYGETDEVKTLLAEQEGLKDELHPDLPRVERAAASGGAGVHLADQAVRGGRPRL